MAWLSITTIGWAVSFAVSCLLAWATFRVMPAFLEIEISDGLGNKRSYPRIWTLAPLGMLALVGAGFAFDMFRPGPFSLPDDPFILVWFGVILLMQALFLLAALARKQSRRAERKDLFGE
ncbi:MAG: hypothetical protein Q7U20_11085 [Caulobacter sp.]|nr:hypothetical protein [Caulobacter sp.]